MTAKKQIGVAVRNATWANFTALRNHACAIPCGCLALAKLIEICLCHRAGHRNTVQARQMRYDAHLQDMRERYDAHWQGVRERYEAQRKTIGAKHAQPQRQRSQVL